MENLRLVPQKIREAKLKLSPKWKVKYVGHVVSGAGIEIDQDKSNKEVNWPKPTTPEDVRRFLGFVGFIDVYHFSKVSKTLTDLINKEENRKSKNS